MIFFPNQRQWVFRQEKTSFISNRHFILYCFSIFPLSFRSFYHTILFIDCILLQVFSFRHRMLPLSYVLEWWHFCWFIFDCFRLLCYCSGRIHFFLMLICELFFEASPIIWRSLGFPVTFLPLFWSKGGWYSRPPWASLCKSTFPTIFRHFRLPMGHCQVSQWSPWSTKVYFWTELPPCHPLREGLQALGVGERSWELVAKSKNVYITQC